jgi:hypothetical protein
VTHISPTKSEDEAATFRALREALWTYTRAENDARLDALRPTPENLLQEIRLIESILLALVHRPPTASQ